MNNATATLWNLADSAGVGALYMEATRNPDKAVRDQFKVDREIRGTRAWAICSCMALSNPSTEYSEEDVAEIRTALGI